MNAEWTPLITLASGFEADITIALLEANDIPAQRDGNDTVGIFGPGFQGATSRGVTILVPARRLAEAQALLDEPRELADDILPE
jgi:Putative prokaryotic signal transducing protein